MGEKNKGVSTHHAIYFAPGKVHGAAPKDSGPKERLTLGKFAQYLNLELDTTWNSATGAFHDLPSKTPFTWDQGLR
jgi:hypothetical protein